MLRAGETPLNKALRGGLGLNAVWLSPGNPDLVEIVQQRQGLLAIHQMRSKTAHDVVSKHRGFGQPLQIKVPHRPFWEFTGGNFAERNEGQIPMSTIVGDAMIELIDGVGIALQHLQKVFAIKTEKAADLFR